jgi:hypothetical protein
MEGVTTPESDLFIMAAALIDKGADVNKSTRWMILDCHFFPSKLISSRWFIWRSWAFGWWHLHRYVSANDIGT